MSKSSLRVSKRLEAHIAYLPGEQPVETSSVIKLNTNENPYPPSPAVQTSVGQEVALLNLYPNPKSSDLRKILAELHSLDPNQIILGNGSDDLLNLCVRCYSDDELKVAMMYPSYSLYEVLSGVQGSKMIRVPFLDGEFSLNLDAIASSEANLFFLTSPHAPSGRVYALEDLRKVAQAVSGLLVIDEAYVDFAPESALPLVHEFEHILITRTLSKSYSLAGMRVGYAMGHPKVIKQMDQVREVYNLDRLAQVGAKAAILDQEYFRSCLAKVIEQRNWLANAFNELGWSFVSSGTNFIFVKPLSPDGCASPEIAVSLFEHLAADKILVRYFSKHPQTNCFLRISIGKPVEMAMLMKSIKAWTQKA